MGDGRLESGVSVSKRKRLGDDREFWLKRERGAAPEEPKGLW